MEYQKLHVIHWQANMDIAKNEEVEKKCYLLVVFSNTLARFPAHSFQHGNTKSFNRNLIIVCIFRLKSKMTVTYFWQSLEFCVHILTCLFSVLALIFTCKLTYIASQGLFVGKLINILEEMSTTSFNFLLYLVTQIRPRANNDKH